MLACEQTGYAAPSPIAVPYLPSNSPGLVGPKVLIRQSRETPSAPDRLLCPNPYFHPFDSERELRCWVGS